MQARVWAAALVAIACFCLGAQAAPINWLQGGSNVASQHPFTCSPEFMQCGNSNSCVMLKDDCGVCEHQADGRSEPLYLCPDRKTCVNEDKWDTCPGLKGTLWDTSMSREDRVKAAVGATSVSDWIAQLVNDAPAIPEINVPAYNWLNDDQHGLRGSHGTYFPDGCGLGATWSKQALATTGRTIATEARATHNSDAAIGNRGTGENGDGITIYAPNINLAMNPLWGRASEVFGEDPYLTSALANSYVEAIQANEEDTLLAAACCKHFIAYDVEDIPAQRHNFSAHVTSRNMWETYMPMFEACIRQAKGAHVMCSYNELNGVPTCADNELLNGVLRQRWNYDGFVVSDYDSVMDMVDSHKYTDNYGKAMAMALNAGMDQEGGGDGTCAAQLPDALAKKEVSEETISTAFGRLLLTRIKLGMFDGPWSNPWNSLDKSLVEGTADEQKSLDVAKQSMCLYKNEQSTLPLKKSSAQKIAIIGPLAANEDALLGNYAQHPDRGVKTILDGIRQALGDNVQGQCTPEYDTDYFQPGQNGLAAETYSDCCQLCESQPDCVAWTFYEYACFTKTSTDGKQWSSGRISGTVGQRDMRGVEYNQGCKSVDCSDGIDKDGVAAAVQDSDVIVAVIGEDQSFAYETHDRTDWFLPAGQLELLQTIKEVAKDKKIVTVLVHGSMIDLSGVMPISDAVVDAWFPGAMGGDAVASVLFGDYNPAGRSPVTFYTPDAVLPPLGDMNPYPHDGTQGLSYRFFKGSAPIIPFGFGLSYTSFKFSGVKAAKDTISPCDAIKISVKVANSGDVDGEEVVQAYTRLPDASVDAPNIRLAAFERVAIGKGKETTVELQIQPRWRSVVLDNIPEALQSSGQTVEPGRVEVWIGNGQPGMDTTSQGQWISVQVKGESTSIESCPDKLVVV